MLRVWLPLTKDLRQQGLDNTSTITLASGNAFVDGGKVGNKAFHLTKQQTILDTSSCMSGKKQMSYAFWVKVNTAWSAQWLDGIAWYSTDGSSAAYYSRQEFYTNCTRIGTWFSGSSLSGYVFTPGEWTHIAGTFDYTAGIAKFYINGVLQGTSTSLSKTHYCRGDFYIGDNGVDIVENDVRIYDHCLSPMEVKQISQGLVLHYPLNREGWGQENLMPNSTIMSVGSANASTGSWRVAGSSQMTRSRVAISDSPIGNVYGCQSVGLQTGQDASCWGIDGFPRENGTTYTISAWGRIVGGSSTAAMLGFSVYSGTTLDYGGTYGQAKSSDTKYYGSGAYDYAGGQLNPNGSWTRIYRTFTSTSTSDNIYIGFNTAKTGNNVTLQLCGVKLEKGDKVTSWCPKSTDDLADIIGLNENIEYDTSGFCNNGIWHGIHTNTSDTPRYEVSTTATGSGTTYLEGVPLPAEVKTVSLWIKNTSKSSNGAIFNDKTSGLQIGLLNSLLYMNCLANTAGFTTTHWKNGEWNHVVAINNNGTRSMYVNGQAEVQSGANNYYIHNTDNFWLWNRSYNNNYPFTGSLSDLRIYATALSADDVRALYENSAYIDNSGNTYAATYTEV